jgi:hypothetical protein
MRRLCGLVLLVPLLAPAPAAGCAIPVFRFALERWVPSSYEALVFHKGPLSDSERQAVRKLEESRQNANLEVRLIDMAGKVDPAFAAMWKTQSDASLPRIVLRYPQSDEKAPPAWSGPLAEQTLAEVLDSPLRRQMARNFGQGASVVFLLVESGDAVADGKARNLLEKELPRLARTIVLPEPTPDGPQLRSPLPLGKSFPILTLSRSDGEEAALLQQLLNSDADVAAFRGPIVFPIFGRGRVLAALYDENLTAREIDRITNYLCAACSCQVKEQNPGVDLLVSADWETLLAVKEGDIDPPSRPQPEPTIPPGAPSGETVPDSSSGVDWRWFALVGTGVLVLMTGVWVLGQTGKRRA